MKRRDYSLDQRDIKTSSGRLVRIRERRTYNERYYPQLYTYDSVPIVVKLGTPVQLELDMVKDIAPTVTGGR